MQRPLLLPVIAFALGILIASGVLPPSTSPPHTSLTSPTIEAVLIVSLVGLPGIALVIFLYLSRQAASPSLQSCLVLLVCLLLGFWRFASAFHPVPWDDLRRFACQEPELATVRVRLLESPRLKIRESATITNESSIVYASVVGWKPRFGSWHAASGRIAIFTRGDPGSTFFRGQQAEVFGVLGKPGGPSAPGLFNHEKHLQHHGIFRQLTVDSPTDWQSGPNASQWRPLSERFLPWAHQALQEGLPDGRASRLLRSMTLGWKTAITGEIREDLMRAGTMHVFAISGLHITLISTVLFRIFQLCRIPSSVCALPVICLTWFYVAATGWPSSGFRAATMATVLIAGGLVRRPSDSLNSMALAAGILLWCQPAQLFLAGFQFSFTVVIGLLTLVRPVHGVLCKLAAHDPLLPIELVAPWRRLFTSLWDPIALALSVSIVAWGMSLPLTIHHFNLFNPVALPANLLALPMATLALCACLATLITSALHLPIDGIFRASAWFWMQLLIQISERASEVPWASRFVLKPPPLIWIPYYVAWLLPILNISFLLRIKLPFQLAIAAGVSVLIVGSLILIPQRKTYMFLPVTGESALLDRPGKNEDLLFNTGSESHVENVVVRLLRSRGMQSAPPLVITHTENRFVKGLPQLVELAAPPYVGVPHGRHRGTTYRRHLEYLNATGTEVKSLGRDDAIASWDVLHPDPTDRYTRADDNALVISRTIDGIHVLWLSALGQTAQGDFARRYDGRPLDILIAHVPGRGEALGEELLATLKPRVLIVASGWYPAQTRLTAKLRQRLSQGPWHFFATAQHGAIQLTIDSQAAHIESVNGYSVRIAPSGDPPRPRS